MDFDAKIACISRQVGVTHQYIRGSDGVIRYNDSRTGVNDTLGEYLVEGSRIRYRLRHTATNPFAPEGIFPGIDYEWEVVAVPDGAATARGLHDGAPNFEIHHYDGHGSPVRRTYSFGPAFNLEDLNPPMEEKGKSWCFPSIFGGGACAGFGSPRWV